MKRLLFAAFFMAACGKHAEQPPKTHYVELVAPGAEPRHIVFYALTRGQQTTCDLTIDMALAAGTLGGPMPTMATALEITVDNVLPDGRFVVRTKVFDAVARERAESKLPVAALNAQLDRLKGITLMSTLSADGRITDTKVAAGTAPLPAELEQQLGVLTSGLDQIAMPLPTEAIGIGAKWKSTRTLLQNGLTTTATSTIDIVSLEGTKLGYTMTTTLAGQDQTVTEAGTQIDVKHLRGTGSGKGTIDLAKLAPHAEASQELSADMSTPGEDTAMKMEMKLSLTPR